MWVIQLSFGRDHNGKRRRLAAVAKSREAVLERAAQLKDAERKGKTPITSVIRVEDLVARFRAEKHDLKPSTMMRYETAFTNYILPSLGKHKIAALQAPLLNRFLASCYGGPTEGTTSKPFEARPKVRSANTVKNVKIALGSLMTFAAVFGYGPKPSVMHDTVEIIVNDERQAYEMTDPELARFLSACASHPAGPLFEVILFQALREAEGFGVRWSDVLWTTNQLHVQWQVRSEVGLGRVGSRPKWGSTRKETPLMKEARNALERRSGHQARERSAAGAGWRAGPEGYIFTTAMGEPIYPKLAWRWFAEVCTAAGIPWRPTKLGLERSGKATHLTIGDLRHNGARMHQRSGTKVEVIAKLLGHSRITTTQRYLGSDTFVPTAAEVVGANRYFSELQDAARREVRG